MVHHNTLIIALWYTVNMVLWYTVNMVLWHGCIIALRYWYAYPV